ncbi:hypothetical protein [Allobaculum sp. Allo2]|uniref:hypothetical protein n=1 Tax=Allobaculum sp. Allo2 TaxID=2853432 RepID=UPI001F60CDAD|nr:hypothetical protein [Allobaculum sp. Allo2]
MNRMSDVDMVDGARDYRMMNREFVNAILELEEYNRFSKGIFGWVGFKTKWLEYENIKRAAGETKWSFWKLFKYAITGIVSFSTVPLQFAAALGVLFSLVAFVMIIVIVVRKICFGDPVQGWASTVCIIMLIGGFSCFRSGCSVSTFPACISKSRIVRSICAPERTSMTMRPRRLCIMAAAVLSACMRIERITDPRRSVQIKKDTGRRSGCRRYG